MKKRSHKPKLFKNVWFLIGLPVTVVAVTGASTGISYSLNALVINNFSLHASKTFLKDLGDKVDFKLIHNNNLYEGEYKISIDQESTQFVRLNEKEKTIVFYNRPNKSVNVTVNAIVSNKVVDHCKISLSTQDQYTITTINGNGKTQNFLKEKYQETPNVTPNPESYIELHTFLNNSLVDYKSVVYQLNSNEFADFNSNQGYLSNKRAIILLKQPPTPVSLLVSAIIDNVIVAQTTIQLFNADAYNIDTVQVGNHGNKTTLKFNPDTASTDHEMELIMKCNNQNYNSADINYHLSSPTMPELELNDYIQIEQPREGNNTIINAKLTLLKATNFNIPVVINSTISGVEGPSTNIMIVKNDAYKIEMSETSGGVTPATHIKWKNGVNANINNKIYCKLIKGDTSEVTGSPVTFSIIRDEEFCLTIDNTIPTAEISFSGHQPTKNYIAQIEAKIGNTIVATAPLAVVIGDLYALESSQYVFGQQGEEFYLTFKKNNDAITDTIAYTIQGTYNTFIQPSNQPENKFYIAQLPVTTEFLDIKITARVTVETNIIEREITVRLYRAGSYYLKPISNSSASLSHSNRSIGIGLFKNGVQVSRSDVNEINFALNNNSGGDNRFVDLSASSSYTTATITLKNNLNINDNTYCTVSATIKDENDILFTTTLIIPIIRTDSFIILPSQSFIGGDGVYDVNPHDTKITFQAFFNGGEAAASFSTTNTDYVEINNNVLELKKDGGGKYILPNQDMSIDVTATSTYGNNNIATIKIEILAGSEMYLLANKTSVRYMNGDTANNTVNFTVIKGDEEITKSANGYGLSLDDSSLADKFIVNPDGNPNWSILINDTIPGQQTFWTALDHEFEAKFKIAHLIGGESATAIVLYQPKSVYGIATIDELHSNKVYLKGVGDKVYLKMTIDGLINSENNYTYEIGGKAKDEGNVVYSDSSKTIELVKDVALDTEITIEAKKSDGTLVAKTKLAILANVQYKIEFSQPYLLTTENSAIEVHCFANEENIDHHITATLIPINNTALYSQIQTKPNGGYTITWNRSELEFDKSPATQRIKITVSDVNIDLVKDFDVISPFPNEIIKSDTGKDWTNIGEGKYIENCVINYRDDGTCIIQSIFIKDNSTLSLHIPPFIKHNDKVYTTVSIDKLSGMANSVFYGNNITLTEFTIPFTINVLGGAVIGSNLIFKIKNFIFEKRPINDKLNFNGGADPFYLYDMNKITFYTTELGFYNRQSVWGQKSGVINPLWTSSATTKKIILVNKTSLSNTEFDTWVFSPLPDVNPIQPANAAPFPVVNPNIKTNGQCETSNNL